VRSSVPSLGELQSCSDSQQPAAIMQQSSSRLYPFVVQPYSQAAYDHMQPVCEGRRTWKAIGQAALDTIGFAADSGEFGDVG
jgi:hypothetical protein